MQSGQLIQMPLDNGWQLGRITGSYHHYKHPEKRGLVSEQFEAVLFVTPSANLLTGSHLSRIGIPLNTLAMPFVVRRLEPKLRAYASAAASVVFGPSMRLTALS